MISHTKTSSTHDQHRIGIDEGAEVGLQKHANAIELHLSHAGDSVALVIPHGVARAIAALLDGSIPPPRPPEAPLHE